MRDLPRLLAPPCGSLPEPRRLQPCHSAIKPCCASTVLGAIITPLVAVVCRTVLLVPQVTGQPTDSADAAPTAAPPPTQIAKTDDYFLNSASDIGFFFEDKAFDDQVGSRYRRRRRLPS